jgi:cyclic-di-GMP-binding protein
MAKDHTFDIVSKVDLQELRNAVQMAQKEIRNRFDLKGTSANLELSEGKGGEKGSGGGILIKLQADNTLQLKSVIDVLDAKLVKRGVSLKVFEWKEPEQLPSGGSKQEADLTQGIPTEKGREIVKTIKELKLKVQPRIDGDAVRVAAKQIDDLQTVMQSVKGKDFGLPLQFENYR